MGRSTLTPVTTLTALHFGAAYAGHVEKLPPGGTARFQVSYVQWAGGDVEMGDKHLCRDHRQRRL